jgi:hypothetical protein
VNNKLSINISDYHIKKFDSFKKELSDWEYQMYYYTNDKIVKQIEKYKPYRVNLLGDIYDTPPVNAEQFIFNDLLNKIRGINLPEYSGADIDIILLNGNHELLPNQSNKNYFHTLTQEYLKKQFDVKVFEYKEVKSEYQTKPFLYCGHSNIKRLESLTKRYSVVFSHFRSSDPKDKAIYTDEIDLTILKEKADLVVLGDIHTRLKFDNVVYCGTPICTSFHDKKDEPSILLLNEETLEFKYLDTIKDKYNKKIISFNEADSSDYVLGKLNELKEQCKVSKAFYKVKIVNTKSFIQSLKLEQFKSFCIIEPTYTDMKIMNTEEKEIAEIVKASNLSNVGTEQDFETYVEANNSRKELSDKLKTTLNFIKGGIFND